jgi:murein L,D-transpeptidase YcbB/YkuD
MAPCVGRTRGTRLAQQEMDGLGTLMRMPRTAEAAILAAAMTAACSGVDSEKAAEVSAALRQAVTRPNRPSYVTSDAEGRRLWKLTREFYERRDYAPAWIDGTTPRPEIEEFVNALRAAEHEGLDPELYSVEAVDARWRQASEGFLTKKGFEPDDAGAFDAWLTYLYMRYSSDLADGLSDLAHADPSWQIRPEKFDPRARLERALDEREIATSLRTLTPDHPQYRALRDALRSLREQAAEGSWPVVPASARLEPGERSPHVLTVAQRLAASGDFDGRMPASGPVVYDGELREAVRRFQRRHGLKDDGIVGPAVVAEMNVPLEQRIRLVQINLERWRWLPHDMGDRFILVNVPEYRLEVWDDGAVPLSMRVVVGKNDTPTPIFNDKMTSVVFSPYWNVPDSIAEGETLPALINDPDFLLRANMEIVDTDGNVVDPSSIDLNDPTQYRFRQRPGADNSLGLVKFMFPNQHSVYLHDTPADSLFERTGRSLSHGCVRVEKPVELALYVLRDRPEWTREKIEEAMHAGEERAVKLKTPLPVYLGYWTARVSSDGVLQFRKDVYGIDKRQSALLADRLARLRRSAAPPTTKRTAP